MLDLSFPASGRDFRETGKNMLELVIEDYVYIQYLLHRDGG